MKNVRLLVAACVLTSWAGCSDYSGGKQAAGSGAGAPYGSATDISTNGELPAKQNNAADNGQGGPVQRQEGNYQSQPAAAGDSDSELASRIKVALTTGSTGTTGAIAANQLTKIDVKVKNGHVTLTGPVTTQDEKNSIGRQVADFAGVKSVENNLTVGARTVQDTPLEPVVPRTTGNR